MMNERDTIGISSAEFMARFHDATSQLGISNAELRDAPERIWAASSDSDGWHAPYAGQHECEGATEYVRADVAEAMVQAAVAAAMKEVVNIAIRMDGSDEWYANLRPPHIKRMMAVFRREVLTLIPDAGRALDRALAEAEARGMERALNRVSDEWNDALYGDLEQGVKSLSDAACEKFRKEYPAINAFSEWLAAQDAAAIRAQGGE